MLPAAPSRTRRGRSAVVLVLLALTALLVGCSKGSGSDSGQKPVAMGSGSGGGSSTTQPFSSTTGTSTVPVPTGPTVPPPTGNAREDFVTAIAQTFRRTVPASVVSDDQVNCVAEISVGAIGVEAFTSRGLTAAEVADPAFSYSQLGMERSVANKVVGAYQTCGIDTRALVLASLASVINARQSDCIDSRVDEDLTKVVLAELLMYGTNSPETSVKIRAIARACGVKAN